MRLPVIIRKSLVYCSVGVLVMSCALTKDRSSTSLVTIDGTPVTTDEFLYVYNKNNLNPGPVDSTEIRNYLDLFINFRLKVREAEALGLDQDSAFIEELEGYRKQLASPYLTETRLLDSLTQVTYKRLKTEINASHLLIQVDEDATAADTLAAFERITGIRNEILSGLEFSQAATRYSEDPSARRNQGNLGYFSAMQMVYPFEEAAYLLPLDSISTPVRTSFGYHLIKVHDKRPSRGKIQVSHILVRTRQGMSPADSLLSAKRADEIYRKANQQEDWDLLCRQFSEDVGTKMKGGRLPWFKTGDISNIPAFEEAAFNLNQIGEISKPVKTAYGWHIIRLEGKEGLESFKEMEPRIRSNVSANSRAKLNQQELIKRLKEENRFKENKAVIDEALSFANETLNKGTWQAAEHWGVQGKVLFSIGDASYPVSDLYEYVEAKQPLPYRDNPAEMMRTAYDEFTKEALIDYEDAHLSEKYYDYRMLLKEYRDGILLFQLMETKVWNQAIQDTTGLRKFFEENQQQYQWDTRAKANIYNAKSRADLDQVQEFIDRGFFKYGQYDFYGNTEALNKAQVGILSDITQLLLQDNNRYLVIEFDDQNTEHQQIYQLILEKIETQAIDPTRLVPQTEQGVTGIILYAASKSAKDLVENMNKKDPLTIQWESGQFQPGENAWVDQVSWVEGTHLLEVDNRFILVEITEVIPAGDQELDEIKGQVISDYQTELEKEWVKELRNKYQVDIHEKELDKIFEQYHN